jgi:hypothetical protein
MGEEMTMGKSLFILFAAAVLFTAVACDKKRILRYQKNM